MKIRYGIALSLASAFIISGCGGLGSTGATNWSDSQRNEFLQILQEDKYSSVCDLQPMVAQYQQTKDDKILNQLLVKYSDNLANSCIDQNAFKAGIRAKEAKNIKTHYEFYNEYVSSSDIMAKLKSGATVSSILDGYAPQMPQFFPLIDAYNAAVSPVQKYKIKQNIERVKLLKPTGWNTYVLINVPEYKFRFFENGQKVMEFKVVVGRQTWQTPIFSSTMKYITVHPTWNVPDNIARKEIIPAIIRDKSYLSRHNMVVKKDYAPDSPKINPSSVNWKLYLTPEWANKNLPYKIIEQASSRNALGTVKFMFPNRFSVYMHDTNSKGLFSRQLRAYSHGCIRLEKPLTLLGHLSTYYTKQKFEEVGSILKAKKTRYVGLAQKIPVHIAYLTAYVENGVVNFYTDIYGFDKITKLKVPTKMVKREK